MAEWLGSQHKTLNICGTTQLSLLYTLFDWYQITDGMKIIIKVLICYNILCMYVAVSNLILQTRISYLIPFNGVATVKYMIAVQLPKFIMT